MKNAFVADIFVTIFSHQRQHGSAQLLKLCPSESLQVVLQKNIPYIETNVLRLAVGKGTGEGMGSVTVFAPREPLVR